MPLVSSTAYLSTQLAKVKRSSLIFVLLVSLAGCMATPLPTRFLEGVPPLDKDVANVYFVRESIYFGNAVWPAILLNGRRVAPLPNGTFTLVKLKPGTYELTMEKEQWTSGGWTGTAMVDVQPGRNYYFQLQLLYRSSGGIVMAGATPVFTREAYSEGQRWIQLEERIGSELVRDMRFVDPFVTDFP